MRLCVCYAMKISDLLVIGDWCNRTPGLHVAHATDPDIAIAPCSVHAVSLVFTHLSCVRVL